MIESGFSKTTKRKLANQRKFIKSKLRTLYVHNCTAKKSNLFVLYEFQPLVRWHISCLRKRLDKQVIE